jgi:succinate dehydrogenase / fumarate reductase cytochrome b subunit
MTGFALSIIILFSPVFIYFLTNSAHTHQIVISLLQNFFIKLIFSLALFALFYHLCNGIRHLAWDAGYGLDLDSSYKSGYIILGLSISLTLLTLFLIGAF